MIYAIRCYAAHTYARCCCRYLLFADIVMKRRRQPLLFTLRLSMPAAGAAFDYFFLDARFRHAAAMMLC